MFQKRFGSVAFANLGLELMILLLSLAGCGLGMGRYHHVVVRGRLPDLMLQDTVSL